MFNAHVQAAITQFNTERITRLQMRCMGDGLAVALFANDDNHRGIVFCTDEPLPDEELEGLWNNEVDAILLVQLQVGVQRALVLDARELLLCQLLWFCTVKEVCV